MEISEKHGRNKLSVFLQVKPGKKRGEKKGEVLDKKFTLVNGSKMNAWMALVILCKIFVHKCAY